MEGFIAFLIVIAIFIILIVSKNKKNKKKNYLNTKPPAKTTVHGDTKPKTGGTAEPFHASKTEKEEEEERHKITKILVYDAKNRGGWVCQNCESENSLSFDKCNVCNHHR